MKWLLLLIWFSGPTSANKIDYEWTSSKEECEQLFKNKFRNENHICIPFEK